MTPARAVFVFTSDQDLLVFPNLEDAGGYMEALDVPAGEYPALYTDQGTVIEASVTAGRVVLTGTDRRDEGDLSRRLGAYAEALGVPAPTDPMVFANGILRTQWEARGPRRPRWLSRRVRGEGPPVL